MIRPSGPIIVRGTTGYVDTCPAIWNVFHDGIIVGVEGSIPGDLAVLIECDYLRERFAEPGGQFTLTIHDGSKFSLGRGRTIRV